MKKRASIPMENIVFLILTLIFFVTLMVFVGKSSTSASIYEEIYAKKIALLIDRAKPDTYIYIDISKIVEIAKKNNIKPEDIFEIKDNYVKVNVGFGYSFKYFNNNVVRILPVSENQLKIEVTKK